MTLAAVLLAAGASRRFGPEDKLLAPLHGTALVSHAANAVRTLTPDIKIAVTRSDAVADLLDGFDLIRPNMPDPAMSDSLKTGIKAAQKHGATGALIVLGDMPFVDAELLRAVIGCAGMDTPSAVSDGNRPSPPAYFPARSFSELMALQGDRGASQILKQLPEEALIQPSSEKLKDIDTQDALGRHTS